MPSTERHRRIVTDWFEKSQASSIELSSAYDRFIALWIAFNAWGMDASKKKFDKEMVQWVARSSPLKCEFAKLLTDEPEFRQVVEDLQVACPIRNMRPGSTDSKTIADVSNFEEVMAVIYQIRCNLFHGSKEVDDARDQLLVDLSYSILSRLMKLIVDRI